MTGLRFGVVGVGRLGSAHARVLQEIPDVELAGVHDTDAGRAREVAEQVGYEDLSSFSKLFRRRTGLNPSEHRLKFGRGRFQRYLDG